MSNKAVILNIDTERFDPLIRREVESDIQKAEMMLQTLEKARNSLAQLAHAVRSLPLGKFKEHNA